MDISSLIFIKNPGERIGPYYLVTLFLFPDAIMNCVVFLCQKHELKRELKGYYEALSKRIETVCAPLTVENNREHTGNILSKVQNPVLILQPDVSRLPHGLVDSQVPTACFQIDTYSGTEKRIKWSMLFDYVFVFHPGFDKTFQKAGHPRVICLPHAIEGDLFAKLGPERSYEVGWVGNLEGSLYTTRRRYINALKSRFQMNDIGRHYSASEMADVYKRSKVVVNISRDDYLPDANLRCFEAMAAGTLLMTLNPTELSELGFKEGTHYVSFADEADLFDKIRFFLGHEQERERIASAARLLVMEEHTYDRRAEDLLNIITEDNGRLFSPARQWSKLEVHATYLHYFAKHLMLDPALREMQDMRLISRKRCLRMLPLVIKAFVRSVQLSVIR